MSRSTNTDWYTIEGEFGRTSEKAVCINIEKVNGVPFQKMTVWFPRSQIQNIDFTSGNLEASGWIMDQKGFLHELSKMNAQQAAAAKKRDDSLEQCMSDIPDADFDEDDISF